MQLWIADSSFKQPALKCKPFAFIKPKRVGVQQTLFNYTAYIFKLLLRGSETQHWMILKVFSNLGDPMSMGSGIVLFWCFGFCYSLIISFLVCVVTVAHHISVSWVLRSCLKFYWLYCKGGSWLEVDTHSVSQVCSGQWAVLQQNRDSAIKYYLVV